MAGIATLFEVNKLSVLAQLRAVQRAHGDVPAGIVSESIMAAVGEFVRETQGPEAAFAVLTRHADAVIAPVLVGKPSPENGA